MPMDAIIRYISWGALVLHTILFLVAIWKVWRGNFVIDRLIALDVTSTLVLAVLILIAIVEQDSVFMDIAIGIAALTAISTINMARYLAQERIF